MKVAMIRLYVLDLFDDPVWKDTFPRTVVDKLGIKYVYAIPQTLGDCWDFWGVSNTPDILPEFMSLRELDPKDYLGYGLDRKMVDRLITGPCGHLFGFNKDYESGISVIQDEEDRQYLVADWDTIFTFCPLCGVRLVDEDDKPYTDTIT